MNTSITVVSLTEKQTKNLKTTTKPKPTVPPLGLLVNGQFFPYSEYQRETDIRVGVTSK